MLNTQDYADKQILAAIREYDALRQMRYTIIKLDSPIQRGWRRFYVLTGNAGNRLDRPLLEAILAVIGPEVVHNRRDFLKRRGRRGRTLVEIEQPLRPIPPHEWDRKNYPFSWRRYFRYELLLERKRHWQPYWVFSEPSLYQLKVEPNWLWYFREIDPIVESRLSELDRWLENNNGRRRYNWLKGRARYYFFRQQMVSWQKLLRRAHQHEITQALNTFPEVDSAASHRCGRISPRQMTIFSPCSPTSRSFRAGSIKVMQPTFNRLNGEHYPGGPRFHLAFMIQDLGFRLESMTKDELKDRTKTFALRVMKMIDHLPQGTKGRVIAGQIMRSATSVAANYRSACRARSRPEFLSKLGIVLEEVDETMLWLELIVEGSLLPPRRIQSLIKEADELTAIIFSAQRSARTGQNPKS